ncbi:hypothetical protein HELRODRAFT_169227 [Helobdella robusta]|uniref:Uncharacterized protein n=1 Tax=Helobdella robusta TaxID=6412 RepID=T1F1L6_HELRO|nr:hypothetical protein HELRODRAFT_169227 [Helobdella robusta]ESO08395.1 hypothetical protein HELRODRAFT_169227 [Helobdella robusta]
MRVHQMRYRCQMIRVGVVDVTLLRCSGDIEGSAEVAGEVSKGFNDGINGVADRLTMIKEQTNCPSLKRWWGFAKMGRKNFFIEDGVLYHKEDSGQMSIKALGRSRQQAQKFSSGFVVVARVIVESRKLKW